MTRYLILIIIFSVKAALSNNTIVYDGSNDIINISSNVGIYEDPTGTLDIEQVLKIDSFISRDEKTPNLGVSTSSFWIEIKINNKSPERDIILQLANPMLDVVELYKLHKDNSYSLSTYGDILPYSQREFDHQKFLFNISPENTQKYLLKIKSWEQISLSLSLGTQKKISEINLLEDLIYGLFFGIIIALVLYNIFIFITVKDRSYLYYVFYILFIALTQATIEGYPYRLLWPNMPIFNNHSLIIFPSIAGIATIEFIKLFLKTRQYIPKLHKGLIVITTIYVSAVISKLFGFNNLSFKIIDLNAALISLYALIIGITLSIRGFRSAKFFLSAWLIFLIGVICFVLKNKGILPSNNFTKYIMSIGTSLEVLLLSFALADRINIYKKEKEASQQKTVEALRENEKIIKNQNIVLEQKVTERTSQLNETLNHLKDTQSQLVDAEKMSSLGQLTAGIAHEINNPINFVSSNVAPLRQDIEDINIIIKKYEELENSDNVPEKLKEINVLKEELDFDYLKTELTTIIDGIEDGAKRTTEIVSGLKNFSRLDEGEFKEVNINEGVEATFILIKSKLNGIKIEKSLGNIPNIECNPGKINQLIMNLIDNAIYAIDKKDIKNKDGLISVFTKENGTSIVLSIKDNGVGIPENIKEKLFEPFFTSKDVGEGTGLGLSIVRSIADSHNAKITVNSTVNEGTEIIIEIPIKKGKNGKN